MREFMDVSRMTVIATATSAAPDAVRWTELGLYHRPGHRRPFVAESLGKTTYANEREFRRQRAGKTIEDACGLFDGSRLSDEIVDKAQRWLDEHPEAEGRPAPRVQFDGSGGLRGALLWLYPDAPADASDNHLAKLFGYDFGVPVRTTNHTLANEASGVELPSWCKAFVGALQHFDRDAFHASRRP